MYLEKLRDYYRATFLRDIHIEPDCLYFLEGKLRNSSNSHSINIYKNMGVKVDSRVKGQQQTAWLEGRVCVGHKLARGCYPFFPPQCLPHSTLCGQDLWFCCLLLWHVFSLSLPQGRRHESLCIATASQRLDLRLAGLSGLWALHGLHASAGLTLLPGSPQQVPNC